MHIKFWSKNFEGRRQVTRPGRGWTDNIKMDIRVAGWEGMEWIHLAEDRDQWRALVNTVMNLLNLLTRCMTISFSRRILLLGGRIRWTGHEERTEGDTKNERK
jgi:hypothetical protein